MSNAWERPNHFWFALQVKTRYEKATALALRQKGLEEFLPLHQVRRRWSDRFTDVEEPFFPGYVFCYFDPQYRLPILTTPGVVSVIGFGKTPVPVEEAEIAALRGVVRSGCSAQPCPYLNVGQFVRIDAGPLTGLEGRLVAFKNGHRLVLSVALLQRSVAVEIDQLWVSPASRKSPAQQTSGAVLKLNSAA